jgi:hypothetical protein
MYHYKQHKCNKLGEGWRRHVVIKKGEALCYYREKKGREWEWE